MDIKVTYIVSDVSKGITVLALPTKGHIECYRCTLIILICAKLVCVKAKKGLSV